MPILAGAGEGALVAPGKIAGDCKAISFRDSRYSIGRQEGKPTSRRSGVLSLITMSAIAGAGVVAVLGVVDCFCMACWYACAAALTLEGGIAS